STFHACHTLALIGPEKAVLLVISQCPTAQCVQQLTDENKAVVFTGFSLTFVSKEVFPCWFLLGYRRQSVAILSHQNPPLMSLVRIAIEMLKWLGKNRMKPGVALLICPFLPEPQGFFV